MPAGIYEIGGGTYRLLSDSDCSLNSVLNDSAISSIVGPLAPCSCRDCVDEQGWPVPPSVSAPAQKWHLSEQDLLNIAARVKGLGSLSAATHRWVTNITPGRPTVFLAEIKEAWGYRYLGWTEAGCWTPIMLKLKVLWLDHSLPPSGGLPGLPGTFSVPPKPGRSFFEFFYITRDGELNTGPYSQPVLFPDALEYFIAEMRKSLLAPPEECGEGRDIVC